MSREGRSGDPFEVTDQEATEDQLEDDVEGPSPASQSKVARARPPRQTPASRVKNAEAHKAEQSNSLRQEFFRAATGGTGALLTVNVVLFAAYMKSQWGHISDAVMLAWISATVVEVLGIVYIIARYLFEDGPKK